MTWEVPIEIASSPVHGTGVFTQDRVKAGETVWRFDRSMFVCDPEQLQSYTPKTLETALLGGYLHEPTQKFVWYTDGMQFVNHAEGRLANVTTPEWRPLDEDCVVATRDIEAGEELFEDYGFWTIFNLPRNHWLRLLYLENCPQHYFIMQSLAETRVAA